MSHSDFEFSGNSHMPVGKVKDSIFYKPHISLNLPETILNLIYQLLKQAVQPRQALPAPLASDSIRHPKVDRSSLLESQQQDSLDSASTASPRENKKWMPVTPEDNPEELYAEALSGGEFATEATQMWADDAEESKSHLEPLYRADPHVTYNLLPARCLPVYLSREEKLEELNKAACKTSHKVILLFGPRTHGKAILALQYLHEQAGKMNRYYFQANTIFVLAQSYMRLLNYMGSPVDISEFQHLEPFSRARKICEKCCKNLSALSGILVYENAPAALHPYLLLATPESSRTCIVTSTDKNWIESPLRITTITIGGMSQTERLKILQAGCQGLPDSRVTPQELENLSMKLVHPFSLVQLVALLHHSDETTSNCLKYLQDRHTTPGGHVAQPLDRGYNLPMMLSLTFQHIIQDHKAVNYILEICSMLPEFDVPSHLLCAFVNRISNGKLFIVPATFQTQVVDILRQHQLLSFTRKQDHALHFLSDVLTAKQSELDHDEHTMAILHHFIAALNESLEDGLKHIRRDKTVLDQLGLCLKCHELMQKHTTKIEHATPDDCLLYLTFLVNLQRLCWASGRYIYMEKISSLYFSFEEVLKVYKKRNTNTDAISELIFANNARMAGYARIKGDVELQLTSAMRICEARKEAYESDTTHNPVLAKRYATACYHMGLAMRLCIAQERVDLLRGWPIFGERGSSRDVDALLRRSEVFLRKARSLYAEANLTPSRLASFQANADRDLALTYLAQGEQAKACEALTRIDEYGGARLTPEMYHEPKLFFVLVELASVYEMLQLGTPRVAKRSLAGLRLMLTDYHRESAKYHVVSGMVDWVAAKISDEESQPRARDESLTQARDHFNRATQTGGVLLMFEFQGEGLLRLMSDTVRTVLLDYRLVTIDATIYAYWWEAKVCRWQYELGFRDVEVHFYKLIERWARAYSQAFIESNMADIAWRLIYESVKAWPRLGEERASLLQFCLRNQIINQTPSPSLTAGGHVLFDFYDEDKNDTQQNVQLMRSVMVSCFIPCIAKYGVKLSGMSLSEKLCWLLRENLSFNYNKKEFRYQGAYFERDLEFFLRILHRSLIYESEWLTGTVLIEHLQFVFQVMQTQIEAYGAKFDTGYDLISQLDQNNWLHHIKDFLVKERAFNEARPDQTEWWRALYEYHMLRYRLKRDLGNFTRHNARPNKRGAAESLARFMTDYQAQLITIPDAPPLNVEQEISLNTAFAVMFYAAQGLRVRLLYLWHQPEDSFRTHVELENVYNVIQNSLGIVQLLPADQSQLEAIIRFSGASLLTSELTESERVQIKRMCRLQKVISLFLQEAIKHLLLPEKGLLVRAFRAMCSYQEKNAFTTLLYNILTLVQKYGLFTLGVQISQAVLTHMENPETPKGLIFEGDQITPFRVLKTQFQQAEDWVNQHVDVTHLWDVGIPIVTRPLTQLSLEFQTKPEAGSESILEAHHRWVTSCYKGIRAVVEYVVGVMGAPPCVFSMIAIEDFAFGDFKQGENLLLTYEIIVNDVNHDVAKTETEHMNIVGYFAAFMPLFQTVLAAASQGKIEVNIRQVTLNSVKRLSWCLNDLQDNTANTPTFPVSLYYTGRHRTDPVVARFSAEMLCHIPTQESRLAMQINEQKRHIVTQQQILQKKLTDPNFLELKAEKQSQLKLKWHLQLGKDAIRHWCYVAFIAMDITQWQYEDGSNVKIMLQTLHTRQVISTPFFNYLMQTLQQLVSGQFLPMIIAFLYDKIIPEAYEQLLKFKKGDLTKISPDLSSVMSDSTHPSRLPHALSYPEPPSSRRHSDASSTPSDVSESQVDGEEKPHSLPSSPLVSEVHLSGAHLSALPEHKVDPIEVFFSTNIADLQRKLQIMPEDVMLFGMKSEGFRGLGTLLRTFTINMVCEQLDPSVPDTIRMKIYKDIQEAIKIRIRALKRKRNSTTQTLLSLYTTVLADNQFPSHEIVSSNNKIAQYTDKLATVYAYCIRQDPDFWVGLHFEGATLAKHFQCQICVGETRYPNDELDTTAGPTLKFQDASTDVLSRFRYVFGDGPGDEIDIGHSFFEAFGQALVHTHCQEKNMRGVLQQRAELRAQYLFQIRRASSEKHIVPKPATLLAPAHASTTGAGAAAGAGAGAEKTSATV